MKSNASLSKLNMILLQVLLWTVFYLLMLLYTSHKWEHVLFGFLNTTIATLTYFISAYTHAFWLIPKFLHKGKLSFYFLLSLVFITLLVLLRMTAEKQFLLPLHQKFYAFTWAHFTFTCITILIAFVFGALLRVLFNHINLLTVKKELQEKHAEAELNLLKSQVQPHFLFNTLNNIYSLAQSKSEKTPEMIARLSDLMRYFIEQAPKEKLSLSSELEFIKNYISLEQIRMVDPVTLDWKIDTSALEKNIPPMLLIPFIENVFKHGIDKLNSANTLKISLNIQNQKLVYQVVNSFPGENGSSSGSGLVNLKKRLELLYKEDFTLDKRKENGYYIAELIIPV